MYLSKFLRKCVSVLISATVLASVSIPAIRVNAATTITSDSTGTHDGFYYSFWNQGGGSVSMTLGSGGNYSVNWSNCSNFTAGKGWKTGSPTRNISFTGSFNGGNNGYLALYGWTKNPLIEYYVIEDYGAWTPPGGTSIGTMTSDGGTYNIYKMQRVNQPSIIGPATFDQYFSVRTTKRSSGTVTFSNHVNAWKAKGLNMGTTWDYQIMESEGYQSSGSANITVSEGSPITATPTQPQIGTQTPTQIPTQTSESLRSLTEKIRAKGHEFYFGAAVSGNFSSDQDIMKNEFDIVTCENNMKIGTISPSSGQYNYSGGDSLVNFAKSNNMIVHGHAFVWHKYNPGWVDGTKSMMETYINNVGTHFKDKIYAWDVLNEAIQKDGTYRINAIGSNGQDGASIFGQKQGKQYIDDAFLAARKADPNAKLIYNEYDMETKPAKFDGVYAMIKDLKSRNIPIDGVGFQMHLGPTFTETDANRFADQMQKFADIGVESYVTEMDVGCSDSTQAGLEKQAQMYGWITKACVEQPYCRALQVWGIRDSQSWRINPDAPEDKAIAPLIFNDNGQKKPAYYAIQKALSDALGSSQTTPTPSNVLYGDVNDDGVVDSGDYTILRKYLLGISDLSQNGKIAADVNVDGAVDSGDFTNLRRFLLRIIPSLPVGGIIPTPTTAKATPTPTPVAMTGKLVALTFDDGPSTSLTPLVLDRLEKYKVPATFMMIGQNINDSTSSVVKRIINDGCEIGNHSWAWDNMASMTTSAIQKSVNDTTAAIQKYSGTTPKFFRAPNLSYSNTMYTAIDMVFVQGVTCNDWTQSTTAQQRADAIIAGAKDGAIFLMHDVQPLPHPTAEALDIIIPKLQSQGYTFVTLSDLFASKGVTVNASNDKVYNTVP